MRALLTGSGGFVGKHTLKYLRDNTDIEFILTETEDIVNPAGMPELGHFDYIINLGSASSVEESVKYPAAFIQDNISSMLNVLNYAKDHPPKLFLHLSTVEVYNVTNPYAASKACQEAIADAYWRTYDVPVVIVRSSNIIGPGQSREKFVPKLIDKIKNNEEVDIYTTNGKVGSRVYNTVTNVADAILYLLNHYPTYLEVANRLKTERPPAHFDIGGGEEFTNLEMAEHIAMLLDKTLKYKFVEPADKRPTYAKSLVPAGVLLDRFGWNPPEDFDKGMAWVK